MIKGDGCGFNFKEGYPIEIGQFTFRFFYEHTQVECVFLYILGEIFFDGYLWQVVYRIL